LFVQEVDLMIALLTLLATGSAAAAGIAGGAALAVGNTGIG
jgi:hypothetical protein